MIRTGLDRLLADAGALAGRRWALLGHAASVSAELEPIVPALLAAGAPAPRLLLAPEHGWFAVEQDMVAAADGRDPWSGAPIRSLYGDTPESLAPSPELFEGLDVLLIDLQDAGSRYYTYAATAVWSAEAALAAGCAVKVLDRPNPLGGERIEGNLRRPGFDSFVGAFELPVRHGLTLGELVLLEARRRGWQGELEVVAMEGWRRSMRWQETGRPWLAPSPNLPTAETAEVYPGACLIEATTLSEGRGTTRPFLLVGAPGLDGRRVVDRMGLRAEAGCRFVPTRFRPQFQKHAGEVCGGVRWVVTEPEIFAPYRTGIELLAALHGELGEAFSWRAAPYEFVSDRPAIDLLTGDDALRRALAGDGDLEVWIATFGADEARFREERRPVLLYPEET